MSARTVRLGQALLAAAVVGQAVLAAEALRAERRAWRRWAAGDPSGAADVLEGAAARGDAGASLLRGGLLLQAGRAAEAADELARAVDAGLPPALAVVAYVDEGLARLHLAAEAGPGWEDHARAAWEAAREALRLDPGNAAARNVLLRALDGAAPPASQDRPSRPEDAKGRAEGGRAASASGEDALAPEEARRILDALRGAEGLPLSLGGTRPAASTKRGRRW